MARSGRSNQSLNTNRDAARYQRLLHSQHDHLGAEKWPKHTRIRLPGAHQHSAFLSSSLCSVKNLTLTAYHDQINQENWPHHPAGAIYKVSLLGLGRLDRKLDPIVIRVTMWGPKYLGPLAKDLQVAYIIEVTRVGKLLVHPDGQVKPGEVTISMNEGVEIPITHAYRLDFVVRFIKDAA